MTEATESWSVARPLWLGALGLALLLGGFGAWAVMATLSGAVIAPGQIVVDQNRQSIQHPEGGRVVELLIEEGDRVRASDLLMRLDASDLVTELNVARTNLAELQARRARLEAERDGADAISVPAELRLRAEQDPEVADLLSGQQNLFAIRTEALAREVAQQRGRVTQINAQIQALQAQRDALVAQIELVTAELTRRQDLLARGAGTQDPVMRLQQELVQL